MDRLLLERVATHTFIQRNLNEEIPEYNIEPKQYTSIFEAFVDVRNAHKILQAIRFLEQKRRKIGSLLDDVKVGYFVRGLPQFRSYLDEHKRNYLKRSLDFFQPTLCRRGAHIKEQSQYRLLEVSGRVLSECVNKRNKQVTHKIREQLRRSLKAGVVFVTRHKYALTNLFLPGFWPHAAIYVGSEGERNALGIKQAIERVIVHEGKSYNFDFDFFRSDRLVCTELAYRAYDEIEDIKIDLKERAGRPTLSAEDLCDLAIYSNMFDAVAIFGVKGTNGLETNKQDVVKFLKNSYLQNN